MVNSIINFFKYPIAILSILLFLDLGIIFLKIVYTMIEDFYEYRNFFIGIGIYFITWFILFKNRIGRLLVVLEHEITHTIFALLSFNKIISIAAHTQFGGFMTFMGGKTQGNWLIDVSPYFFSTFGIIVIGIIHISSPIYYPILMGIIGYSVIHHIYNVAVTFSLRQPDIIEAGIPFSILFLPSANLIMLIVMLTEIPNDSIYLQPVIDYLCYSLSYYGHFILNLF